MRYKKKWDRGDKGRLARACSISPQYLSDILAGRKACSGRLAIDISRESRLLGYRLPELGLVFPDLRAGNPLYPMRG